MSELTLSHRYKPRGLSRVPMKSLQPTTRGRPDAAAIDPGWVIEGQSAMKEAMITGLSDNIISLCKICLDLSCYGC